MKSLRRCFCIGVAAAAILMAGTISVQAAPTAKITAIVLSVQHRKGASGEWAKSKVGTLLPAGSRVRTAKRSKCEIRFPDGSIVRMGPRSDMVIQAVTGRQMQLKYGSLWAKFIAGSGARIQGGSAVAAVKGTILDFSSWLNPDGTSDDQCTVYDTLRGVDFVTPRGSTSLMGGFGSSWSPPPPGAPPPPPGAPPPPANPQPPGAFAHGQYSPPSQGFASGSNTQTTPGGNAGLTHKQTQYTSKRLVNIQLPGTYGEEEGELEVIVQQVPERKVRPGSAALFAMAQMPRVASTLVEATVAQTAMPGKLFGKRFFGPYVHTDVFGLWGDNDSLVGLRLRPTAIVGDWYVELGATTWNDFEGNWHAHLSEGFAAIRPKDSEITIGRQHFLEGPVNNSDLGTIIGFDTIDAIRWRRELNERWSMNLGLVQDYLPFTNKDLSGHFVRLQTNIAEGMFGFNWVRESGNGSAHSVDVSLPAVPGAIDLYGEFGCNSEGRHVETWGIYLPALYQKHDIDLFVERASRSGEATLHSLVAYKEISDDLTGVLLLQKSSGTPWSISVGGMLEF